MEIDFLSLFAIAQQSWQKVDINTAQYSREITPLILAAHKDNYEIIKLLLDRGATLPQPHLSITFLITVAAAV